MSETKITKNQWTWAIYAAIAVAVLLIGGYYFGWYGGDAAVAIPAG